MRATVQPPRSDPELVDGAENFVRAASANHSSLERFASPDVAPFNEEPDSAAEVVTQREIGMYEDVPL